MNVVFDFDTVTRKCRIISEHLNEIREVFSVEDKAMQFVRRRFGKHLPARKYAITNKGVFDLPFFEIICKTIIEKFPSLQIKPTEKFVNNWKANPIANDPIKLKFEPRDYQFESASTALLKGRGIIVLPTSAGKTLTICLIAYTALRAKNYKTLILVPNIQLVEQTYQDFLDYGVLEDNIAKWTGNYAYQKANIIIANNQILLSEKQDTTVLNEFDLVIVDECHKLASAEKITKLVKNLKCKHIFGFTGSLPNEQFDVWSLNRIFGPILYYKKSIELRQNQFISNVRVVALELEYKNIPEFTKPSMSEPTAGYEEEINWLHTNKFRNDVLSKITEKLETNTLILVDRIVHGEHLLDVLKTQTTKRIYFIQGSVDVAEREQIREIMEQNSGIVCIAISKLFSTGISIKNLHNVVFAAIGKARIKIIQSIGRSLRLHKTKQMATIFDIADTNLVYGNKHFSERKDIYVNEQIPIISKLIVE
jgi:superfamily II DNA or RNA helicase